MLQVPEPNLDEGRKSRSILECDKFLAIKESYNQGGRPFDKDIKVACQVGNLVRDALVFCPTGSSTPLLRPETLATIQATNCIGHTLVTSELLDEVGVEHFVSFVNQHAIVLLADQALRRSFMLDTAEERLCLETTDVIEAAPLDQLRSGRTRTIHTFYSQHLSRHLPAETSLSKLANTHPWLKFGENRGIDDREESPWNYRLKMISLPSKLGRKTLQAYYDAQIYHNHGNIIAAADTLRQLDAYPDIEPRNQLALANHVVKSCLERGLYTDAMGVAIAVNNSLKRNDTSRNKSFLPDVIRKIGKQMGDTALLRLAIEVYKEQPTKLNNAKLQRARQELSKIC